VLVNNYFGFSWSIQSPNISIQLSIPTQAWIGIGFHAINSTDTEMSNADIITAIWFPNGTFTINDRWSPQLEGQPGNDTFQGGTYDIDQGSVQGFQNSSITLARFSRLLVTPDKKCDQPIRPGMTNVIVAYGQNNAWQIHKAAVLFPLDLFGTSSTTDVTSSSTTGSPTGSSSTSSSSSSTEGTSNGDSKNVNIVIAIGVFVFVMSIANLIAAAILMRRRSNARSKVVIVESKPLLTDTTSPPVY